MSNSEFCDVCRKPILGKISFYLIESGSGRNRSTKLVHRHCAKVAAASNNFEPGHVLVRLPHHPGRSHDV